jgi:hypothetical protein
MMMMIIQFFIIYMPSQQLRGQLQEKHSADTIRRAEMLIITLQIKRSIRQQPLRQSREQHSGNATIFALRNKGKREDKKNKNDNQQCSTEKTNRIDKRHTI